jgi:hypothetical protein
LLVCLVACGGKSGKHADEGDDSNITLGADAGSGESKCTDKDDDGFGHGCADGPDCDDKNPDVTDECTRCVTPNKACPCDPGTMPLSCDPEDKRVTQNGVTGVLVCKEGTRYCRNAAWSDCEIIFQYAMFVPDK